MAPPYAPRMSARLAVGKGIAATSVRVRQRRAASSRASRAGTMVDTCPTAANASSSSRTTTRSAACSRSSWTRPATTCSVSRRGDDALASIARDRPDAVVLDLRLPDRDGLSVCRQARREGHDCPDPDVDCARPARGPRARARRGGGRLPAEAVRGRGAAGEATRPLATHDPCAPRARGRARPVGPRDPRGDRRRADRRADRARVRPPRVPDAEARPRVHARADLRVRLGLQLPGRQQGHRRVRLGAPAQARLEARDRRSCGRCAASATRSGRERPRPTDGVVRRRDGGADRRDLTGLVPRRALPPRVAGR